MIQLIVFIIFLFSVGILSAIVVKKIPALVQLPQNGSHGLKKPEILRILESKIKNAHFHFFQKKMFLHKLLSKTKVMVLKIESWIDALLHGIRKNAQELDKKVKKATRSRRQS